MLSSPHHGGDQKGSAQNDPQVERAECARHRTTCVVRVNDRRRRRIMRVWLAVGRTSTLMVATRRVAAGG